MVEEEVRGRGWGRVRNKGGWVVEERQGGGKDPHIVYPNQAMHQCRGWLCFIFISQTDQAN